MNYKWRSFPLFCSTHGRVSFLIYLVTYKRGVVNKFSWKNYELKKVVVVVVGCVSLILNWSDSLFSIQLANPCLIKLVQEINSYITTRSREKTKQKNGICDCTTDATFAPWWCSPPLPCLQRCDRFSYFLNPNFVFFPSFFSMHACMFMRTWVFLFFNLCIEPVLIAKLMRINKSLLNWFMWGIDRVLFLFATLEGFEL